MTLGFAVSPDVPPLTGEDLDPAYADTTTGSVALAATSGAQAMNAFPAAVFRTCKYIVTVTQGAAVQTAELLVVTDGTSTFLEIYGVMSSVGRRIASYSSSINAGVVTTSISLVSPNAATAKFQATRLAV